MADTDLRAEVLAGIDRERARVIARYQISRGLGDDPNPALTALRHLREIVEEHGEPETPDWCGVCRTYLPCPTMLSLAPDYAPQALAQMEADRG